MWLQRWEFFGACSAEAFWISAVNFVAMTEADSVESGKHVLPETGVLAKIWEAEPSLRQRIFDADHNCLTRWPDVRSTGLASCKSMGMNALLLEGLATAWTAVNEYPHAVPVEYLRQEAGFVLLLICFLFILYFFYCRLCKWRGRCPWQVREFRKLLGREDHVARTHLDGSGLKVLFSRGIRRFKAQQFKTRVLWLPCFI